MGITPGGNMSTSWGVTLSVLPCVCTKNMSLIQSGFVPTPVEQAKGVKMTAERPSHFCSGGTAS